MKKVHYSNFYTKLNSFFSFQSLRQLGLYHVLNMYLCGVEGVRGDCVGLTEYQYEAAWRCGQWEEGGVSLVTPVLSPSGDYHQTLYSCLTALKDGEIEVLNSSIAEAR